MTHAYTWVPYLISTGNVTSFLLSSYRRPICGAAVMIFTQGTFALYVLVTHQQGFLLQNAVLMASSGVVIATMARKSRQHSSSQTRPTESNSPNASLTRTGPHLRRR